MRSKTGNNPRSRWPVIAACWLGLWCAHSPAGETANARAGTEMMISVRSGQDMAEERGATGSVRISTGNKATGSATATGETRVYRTRSRARTQQVRVLEGHSAYISHSQSDPYPTVFTGDGPYGGHPYYGLEYRDLQRAFEVRPRLVDGQLLLDISADNQRWSERRGGSIDTTAIQTTVRAQPGQWIRLGGTEEASNDEAGKSYRQTSTSTRSSRESEIWVRVELLE